MVGKLKKKKKKVTLIMLRTLPKTKHTPQDPAATSKTGNQNKSNPFPNNAL